MACETMLRPKQTLSERIAEINALLASVEKRLATGVSKLIVDKKTGAITVTGISNEERAGITDACIYRRLKIKGSAQTKLAIMRAEQLAGRSVNLQALAHGVHSHDGGHSWHKH